MAPPSVPAQAFPGPHWEIRLLGAVATGRHGDIPLPKLPDAVALMLAVLLLEPREHDRDELARLLWPRKHDFKSRANSLRNALAVLRRALEPPGVRGGSVVPPLGRKRVRLNADAFDCDAVEYERLAGLGDAAAAIARYRGELLPGFTGEWVESRRRALAARFDQLARRAQPATPPLPQATDRALVTYDTDFFGRETEGEWLRGEIRAHRLVWVSGVGGCGKTRLCARIAQSLEAFEHHKFFVPLAECVDASQILGRLRASLDLYAVSSDAEQQVVGRLAGERALLLFDNVEQIDAMAAEAVLLKLLDSLPDAHLLVTSRAAPLTDLARHLPLAPLPLAEPGADVAQALCSPAVAMFVNRAQAARPGFHAHDGNVADVIEACALLDGMPALIELAAARTSAFSPRVLCDSLRGGQLLGARLGTRATRAGRHASQAAVVDWSLALLAEREQQVLAAAAVGLRAGWTAADLEAVSGRADTAPALEELLRLSFVRVAGGHDVPARHQMYESIRQPVRHRFVPQDGDLQEDDVPDAAPARRLRLPPDALAAMRLRHRLRFVDHATRLLAARERPHALDIANVEEAIASAADDLDTRSAVTIALAMREHWMSNGAPAAVLEALWRIVGQAGAASLDAVVLAAMLARLMLLSGQMSRTRECVAIASQMAARIAAAGTPGHAAAGAEAALARANVLWLSERDAAAARPVAQLALDSARASADALLVARALTVLGSIRCEEDPVGAAGLFAESEALFLAAGDEGGALDALPGLTASLLFQSRHDEVLRLCEEGERRAIEAHKLTVRLLLLNRLAESHAARRRFEDALAANRRIVRWAQPQGIVYHVGYGLWNQPYALARLRRPEQAARLMAFAERYWAERGGKLNDADRRYIERVHRLVVTQIGAVAWQTSWQEGWNLPLREGLRLGGA